ncbi:MAG: hypothetical protein COV66_12360 [Nitrospinae bacterium CG11_big_fil_rev_8_21_14_0_20_45_15]|nr:MAG: hypothetical protein COV66_12360 [Nitrospinae bacterium CG11_big_fil_rev_8_21_14_0_20_45_15]
MSDAPVLIKKFGSYNLIKWKGTFYGLPLSVGPVQMDKGDLSLIPALFQAQTMIEVEKLIVDNRSLIQKHTQPLLEETYGFYNIVVWGAIYYGIPKVGAFNFTSHDEIADKEGVFFNHSLPELKKQMENYCRNQHKKNAGLTVTS